MYILTAILGYILGSIISINLYKKLRYGGTLHIDSRGEKTKYQFAFDDVEGLLSLQKKSYILLKVDPKADLSQK